MLSVYSQFIASPSERYATYAMTSTKYVRPTKEGAIVSNALTKLFIPKKITYAIPFPSQSTCANYDTATRTKVCKF
jgi:hypothetical protein